MRYRMVLIIFLLLLPVGTFAENEFDSKLLKEIEAKYPKAYIIQKDDFLPFYRNEARVVVSGDFDCNGIKDDAVQIYHDGVIKLIAAHRFKGDKYEIIEISKTGELPLNMVKGHHENIIALKKRGQRIEFYCDCESNDKEEQRLCKKYSDKKSSKGCSLKLKCDAIEWIYDEKAAELFYFDKEINRYQSVTTAD